MRENIASSAIESFGVNIKITFIIMILPVPVKVLSEWRRYVSLGIDCAKVEIGMSLNGVIRAGAASVA